MEILLILVSHIRTEEFMKTDKEIREVMDVLYNISGDKDDVMLAEMREKQ